MDADVAEGIIMIVIVTGPPCGGKSTYVQEQAQPGDLIVDQDALALAIEAGSSSHVYSTATRKMARAARNAAVWEGLKAMQGDRYRTLFVIHTDPSPEMRMSYRAMGGRFVEMDPGKDECLRRAQSRPPENRELVKQVLDDYYSKRR